MIPWLLSLINRPMPSFSVIKLSFIKGLLFLSNIMPLLLFLEILFFVISGTEEMQTIPSLFSMILFLIIQALPPSMMNIPSHRPRDIQFSTIIVLTEFVPPRAMLALILSEMSFFSITALLVSTKRTPFRSKIRIYLAKVFRNFVFNQGHVCTFVYFDSSFFVVSNEGVLLYFSEVLEPKTTNAVLFVAFIFNRRIYQKCLGLF